MDFREADWLGIKLDILFRCFSLSLQLFCDYSCSAVWELDSALGFQCVLVFGKNVFNCLKSFIFLDCLWKFFQVFGTKKSLYEMFFFLQMITFCFRFQMEPLSVGRHQWKNTTQEAWQKAGILKQTSWSIPPETSPLAGDEPKRLNATCVLQVVRWFWGCPLSAFYKKAPT